MPGDIDMNGKWEPWMSSGINVANKISKFAV